MKRSWVGRVCLFVAFAIVAKPEPVTSDSTLSAVGLSVDVASHRDIEKRNVTSCTEANNGDGSGAFPARRHRKTTDVEVDAFKTIRINCGGGMIKEADGTVWMKDKYYNKGFSSRPFASRLRGVKRKSIYKSYRYDYGMLPLGKNKPLKYNIPVSNGEYEVTLFFPDQLVSIAPKLRRFNVQMEGVIAFRSDAIANDDEQDKDEAPAASMTTFAMVEDEELEIVFDGKLARRVYVAAIVIESLTDSSLSDWPTPSPLDFTMPAPTLPRLPTTRAPILAAQPLTPVEPIRINAGGDMYTDVLGHVWTADTNYTNGRTFATGDFAIAGTQDDTLYYTERYGDFTYEIELPVGNYEIILHAAETIFDTIGQRVFDVEIENKLIFIDVDLVKLGAGVTKKVLLLETVELVSDGALNIAFKSKVDSAKVSALEIKLSAPHYAHSVTGGPYTAVDSLGVGSVAVEVDGSNSHTHGPGLRLTQFTWKTGAQVLGEGEFANLTLPVGDHTVTLTVVDDGANESTDTTNITVRSGAFPSVTNLLPNTGTISGGNDVTIIGSGFTVKSDLIFVKFGLVTLTGSALQIVDQRTIKLKAPSVTVGVPVSVSVVTPLGESSEKKYTYVAKSQIKFLEGRIAPFSFPTRAMFGPDGKLYLATVDGKLAKLTLDGQYNVVNTVVSTVAASRVIMGLTFDPMETSANPPVYFAHWQIFHGEAKSTSGKAINGKISIAKGANLDEIVDIITGLPVSDGDHGVNGLEFGDNGELYIQVGGNTNGGIPGRLTTSQKQKDMVYSAATLVAYLSRPNFRGFLTYTADDDGDVNPSDVEIFAVGQRNPVGIVLHSNGLLYGTDNGPDKRYGDMATSCDGGTIESVEEDDKINLIVKGGFYGHPNFKRGRSDSRQCVWRSVKVPSSNGYTAPMVVVPSSTNGIFEFHSNHFDGQMRGNLITGQYKGGIYRIILTPDGTAVVPESREPNEFAGNGVLDVTQHPDGTIIDTRYDDGEVYFYKPIERSTRAVLVLSVFPRRGGLAGGSTLTIYGRNLNKNRVSPIVKVGGNDCNVTMARGNKVECTLPGGTGTVDVSASVGSETSTFQRGYRYIPGV